MNRSERIAIVGCGSIGSRHARNARAIGVEDVVLCDSNDTRRSALAEEIGATQTAPSVDAILRIEGIRAVVIATPSSMHVEHAIPFADRGIAVLVEKPLAVSRHEARRLVETVEKHRGVSMIAQSFRFHEGLGTIKRILDEGSLGAIHAALYDSGQYLPDWHPTEDYRKEYSAKRTQGGGVVLTSMSHGLDTIEWLFGEIREIDGWKARVGDLELEEGVDDIAACVVRTASGVIANLAFDFLDRRPRHRLQVVGARGSLEADLIEHRITLAIAGTDTVTRAYPFDPNRRYVEELRHFLALLEGNVFAHDLDARHGAHIVDLLTDPCIVWKGAE